jgi:plastocyanin
MRKLFSSLVTGAILLAGCGGTAAPTSSPPASAPAPSAAAKPAASVQAPASTAASTPAPAAASAKPAASAAAKPAAPAGGRNVSALVGTDQDTRQAIGFFPATLRIHAGDTVSWKINSGEIHTVSFYQGVPASALTTPVPLKDGDPGDVIPYFVADPAGLKPGTDVKVNPQVVFPTRAPGAPVETYQAGKLISSGIMSKNPPAPNQPANDTFQLTFSSPGTYKYVCLIHLLPMGGTVEVVPASADVPDQAAVTAQAQKESKALLDLVAKAEDQGKQARTEAGPNGTNFVFVKAGNNEFTSAEDRAQAFAFFPKDVTIKAGDTVVWGSAFFHSVTFNPTPPDPDLLVIQPPPDGQQLPVVSFNGKIAWPSKPAPTYDPTKYYNSADIGPFSPGGFSWALTFDKPGTYSYFCGVHRELGMKGSIIVQPK